MRSLGRLLFALSLVAVCGLTHTADTLPCKLTLLASLDVQINDEGRVLVPAQIDGQDVWMNLIMTRGLPGVTPAAVALLGLKTSRLSGTDGEVTYRGNPVTQKITTTHLLLGRADFAGWTLYVVPESGDGVVKQFRGKPIVGALTTRFFMQALDVELNLGANRINLFTQTSCSEPVYWGAEFTTVKLFQDRTGLMVFPMELDGKLIEASFNTTSRYSLINSAVTTKYFGFNEQSDGIERETTADGREILSYRAMELSAKGLEVSHARIQLFKLAMDCDPTGNVESLGPRSHLLRNTRAIGYGKCSNGTPLEIGTDLLRKLRIYIASKEQTIYFTRADLAGQSATPAASDPSAAAPAAAPN